MEIRPTPDQEAFIRHAIEAGRIDRPEDAAEQAMAMWEQQERARAEILAHLVSAGQLGQLRKKTSGRGAAGRVEAAGHVYVRPEVT